MPLLFLRSHAIDLRVFILVRPPWLSEEEGLEWAKRSLDFAFDCGPSVCSLIPTRAGNGAIDALGVQRRIQSTVAGLAWREPWCTALAQSRPCVCGSLGDREVLSLSCLLGYPGPTRPNDERLSTLSFQPRCSELRITPLNGLSRFRDGPAFVSGG